MRKRMALTMPVRPDPGRARSCPAVASGRERFRCCRPRCGPRWVRRRHPRLAARPEGRGRGAEVLGRGLSQRRLHPLEGAAAQRRAGAHPHPREGHLRHHRRRVDGLPADARPQPQGRRGERQGRALPDEEEQDRARSTAGAPSPGPKTIEVKRRRRVGAHGHRRQHHHRHRRHHPARAGRRALDERGHLRGADPRRHPARLDRDRRLGRDRRRVRLRDEELRRRRDHRGVPRPDGAHRGRRGLQGAAPAVQEARREGAHLHRREGRARTPASGVRVTVAPAGGGEEQVLEADKFLAAFGFAPRVEGYGLESHRRCDHRPRRDRDRRLRPDQRRRACTRSATSPAS